MLSNKSRLIFLFPLKNKNVWEVLGGDILKRLKVCYLRKLLVVLMFIVKGKNQVIKNGRIFCVFWNHVFYI